MRQVNHLDSFKGIKYLTKTVLSGAVAWLVMSIFSVVAASAAELAAVRPSAMANEPQQFVRELTEDMFSTVDREWDEIRANPLRVYEIVDEIIAPHIDTQRASRLVLGKHWSKASPAQRKRFQVAFVGRMIQVLVTGISDYVNSSDPKSTKVRYLPSRTNGSSRDVTVRSRIGGTGRRPIRVDFRLRRTNGKWKFYDLVIEGASLVLTYRTDYAAEIERTGMEGLIERVASDTPSAYRGHRYSGRSALVGN